jgi:hypothetical protein
MTKLWCMIMFKTNVEQIEKNERFYFYLYPFENIAEGSFQRGFYIYIE